MSTGVLERPATTGREPHGRHHGAVGPNGQNAVGIEVACVDPVKKQACVLVVCGKKVGG